MFRVSPFASNIPNYNYGNRSRSSSRSTNINEITPNTNNHNNNYNNNNNRSRIRSNSTSTVSLNYNEDDDELSKDVFETTYKLILMIEPKLTTIFNDIGKTVKNEIEKQTKHYKDEKGEKGDFNKYILDHMTKYFFLLIEDVELYIKKKYEFFHTYNNSYIKFYKKNANIIFYNTKINIQEKIECYKNGLFLIYHEISKQVEKYLQEYCKEYKLNKINNKKNGKCIFLDYIYHYKSSTKLYSNFKEKMRLLETVFNYKK